MDIINKIENYLIEIIESNIAYRVMKYDPKNKIASSSVVHSNDFHGHKQEKFKPKKGLVIKMSGKGMYLYRNKKLVVDFYAVSDVNILLKCQFNENDVIEKDELFNTKDAIFTVSKAKIVDFYIIDASGNKILQ